MNNNSYNFIIVGAGLTGLNLAREIRIFNQQSKILILEKSKSSGGRMATRRINEARFDHGAQFIKKTKFSDKIIQFGLEKDILQAFPLNGVEAYSAKTGMTQIAKKLSEDLAVHYNQKVLQLDYSERLWLVKTEDNSTYASQNIILTCPLPQSLDLLSRSKIAFEDALTKVLYSKALVFLTSFESLLDQKYNFHEFNEGPVFSITSQLTKGLSTKADYTIVMNTEWSEIHFDKPEEEILNLAQKFLKEKFHKNRIQNIQLKKWRYCQPYHTWDKPYYSPYHNLFLAGDAFGGASLNGALLSSKSLFEYFKTTVI